LGSREPTHATTETIEPLKDPHTYLKKPLHGKILDTLLIYSL